MPVRQPFSDCPRHGVSCTGMLTAGQTHAFEPYGSRLHLAGAVVHGIPKALKCHSCHRDNLHFENMVTEVCSGKKVTVWVDPVLRQLRQDNYLGSHSKILRFLQPNVYECSCFASLPHFFFCIGCLQPDESCIRMLTRQPSPN